MAALVDSIPTPPKSGDLVEGTIIAISRGRIYIDLAPFGTGLIYGREYLNAADVLRKANPATPSPPRSSTRRPRGLHRALAQGGAPGCNLGRGRAGYPRADLLLLTVEEANKGGLILSWQGIQGFLPASQLAKEHYPRVADGDKDKILASSASSSASRSGPHHHGRRQGGQAHLLRAHGQ
jgi:small subunit ribosomal protein S1